MYITKPRQAFMGTGPCRTCERETFILMPNNDA